MDKKKVVIFGANGYFGRNLAHYLHLNDNYTIFHYDLHQEHVDGLSNYYSLDVLNKNQLNSIDIDVDYIFWFVGLNGTVKSLDDYENFIKINEIGLLHLLNTIRKKKIQPRIILPSSRLIYAESNNEFLNENSKKEFKSIYALNKFFCEEVLKIYSSIFGIPFTIFRIGLPYGNLIGRNANYGTVSFFLHEAMNGNNIKLYGNGEQKRTFTHISDILKTFMQSLTSEISINEIYNIGGEELNLKTVASLIALKYNVNVESVQWPKLDLAVEVGDSVFDSSKLDSCIKLKNRINFEAWVQTLH
jgi:UDP-glucose 4-epimerase